MNHKTALLLRFLAVLAVIFCGITAILPQSTVKDDETILPVWSDLTDDNIVYINTVYKKGLMTVSDGEAFGVDKPFVAGECAYIAVRLYEEKNGIKYSFNGYSSLMHKEYTNKASEYGIWETSLDSDAPLKRSKISYCLDKLVDKKIVTPFSFANENLLAFKESVLNLYNLGITLDERISLAFSPYEELTRGDAAKLFAMYIDQSLRTPYQVPDYDTLKADLSAQMASYQGDWSLYFEDYRTGAVVSINSHQVYSASLIKLFVAQTVFDKANKGEITLNGKISDEIRKMLTYSDNEAWKYLARALGGGSYSRGMAEVTSLASQNGYYDTGQFYQGNHKNYNFTSVNDCGAFLRNLLDRKIVNGECSDIILSHLKNQSNRTKIPVAIPDTVEVANKTGELDYIQGDAAIVYYPERTYILVIIGDSLDNGYGQVPKITELSRTVYNFLNS